MSAVELGGKITMDNTSVLTTKEVMKIYQISSFTIRGWRRGWRSDSIGKHFFFPDKSHLEYFWNVEKRQFEYNPIKVAVWVHNMKEKVSRIRILAGSHPKKN